MFNIFRIRAPPCEDHFPPLLRNSVSVGFESRGGLRGCVKETTLELKKGGVFSN